MPLKRVSKFKQEWSLKLKEEYLSWLEPNATLERHAECSICCTDFDIGNIGIGAIESHRKGKRHQERLAHKTNPSVLGFFTPGGRFMKLSKEVVLVCGCSVLA